MTSRENSHYWWLAALVLTTGLLIYLLGPILSPFLFAAILAYICDPLVDKLETWRVPRGLGTALVLLLLFGLLILLLLIFVPLFQKETTMLYERFPAFLSRLTDTVE